MTALLALVAVVAFMAKAGLPWWVVVAVALLMAGFAAGRSGSPGKSARTPSAPGPPGQPVWFPADRYPAARPAPVKVPATRPDEYTPPVRSGPPPMARNG